MIHESVNKVRRKGKLYLSVKRKAEVPNDKLKLYKGKKGGFGPGMSVINKRSKIYKSDDTKR